jgi:2-phospho-L-lactate guanylyltransferase (CobY/MobA/RfbA family)
VYEERERESSFQKQRSAITRLQTCVCRLLLFFRERERERLAARVLQGVVKMLRARLVHSRRRVAVVELQRFALVQAHRLVWELMKASWRNRLLNNTPAAKAGASFQASIEWIDIEILRISCRVKTDAGEEK